MMFTSTSVEHSPWLLPTTTWKNEHFKTTKAVMSHLECAGLAALGVDDVDADLALVHRHVDVLPLLQLLPVVAQDLHRQLRLLLSLYILDRENISFPNWIFEKSGATCTLKGTSNWQCLPAVASTLPFLPA